MPKLIVSIDGAIVKKVQLTKNRSTIGRRPYNDIVIENLAVSGDHAVIQIADGQAVLEDLGSTNGTYVNGQPIRKQALVQGDQIEIGRYKIQYLEDDGPAQDAGPASASAPAPPTLGGDAIAGPRVCVLNGASAGKSLALTKVVTTVGKPGVSVASITQRGHGYDLAHVTGDRVATVNGVAATENPITLKHRDLIGVGGVQLEFLDH